MEISATWHDIDSTRQVNFGGLSEMNTAGYNAYSAHFSSGSDNFAVDGAPLARNAFVYDASATVALDKNASLGIAYAGQFSSGTQSQSLRGEFKYEF